MVRGNTSVSPLHTPTLNSLVEEKARGSAAKLPPHSPLPLLYLTTLIESLPSEVLATARGGASPWSGAAPYGLLAKARQDH